MAINPYLKLLSVKWTKFSGQTAEWPCGLKK